MPAPASPTVTPDPQARAVRAVSILLLLELALAITLAVTSRGWPAIVLIIGCLAALGAVTYLDSQTRRTAGSPRQAWLLLGLVWFSLNLAALLVEGLWLPLALTSLLLSLSLAALLFVRGASTPPMLAGLAATLPILLLEFLLRPAFRLAPPDFLLLGLPYIVITAAAALIVLLLGQFNRLSLRQKLVLTFLFLSLAPVVGLRAIYDFSSRQALTEAATNNLFAAANQTAGAIDNFIAANLATVATQSTLPTFRLLLETPRDDPSYARIEAEANQLIYSLQALRAGNETDERYLINYALLNREGVVIQDTSYPPGEPNNFIGTDLSTDPIFLNAALFAQPYASSIRAPEGMQTARIFFASRVVNAANQPIGVFLAGYSADFLQELLALNQGLAGAGSYGALFDENQIFLAHATQPGLVFQSVAPLDPNIALELVDQGRLPANPSAMTTIGFTELEALLDNSSRQPAFAIDDITTGGARNQVATSRLTSYPWQVAFFQPEEAFLEPITIQTRNSLIFAAAIAAVAVLIALVASNQLAGPILRLTEAAEQVRSGNLNAEAEVTVQDEVGTLTMTFNSMTAQLRGTLSNLERLVAERTSRLEATNEVGRVASSILNRDELISRIVNLISERFGYYYAAIFLVDEDDRWALLKDATGEAGRTLKERNHRLEIGGRSMVGTAISSRSARIALDVGDEPVRFDNPLLPATRSEIALPLIVGEDVLGALDVQSTQEAAFSEQDLETLQTLANQVAIAIENANLFERTQQTAQRQQAMNEFSSRLQRSPDVQEVLATTVTELARLVGADQVAIYLDAELSDGNSNGSA